ncbi:hypothetical protein [Mesorhizobium huakuii]|uniref:Uncharacterized protein n=1 Tax=Mesorhizobium huakuii TaxID=28104 RepID=A0A7G6SUN8_9HYPH|nr:hypothetical protein [Mesorhizobium huakuii]QND58220.1 hypothetical protein HB778_17700 [Mesorhizobium huakuii]
MTFPNTGLGPFEGENEKWCWHAATGFTQTVTMPLLSAPEWDYAHAAVAHFFGFMVCAMADAGRRGDGEQQVMADVLEKIRPILEHLKSGSIGVEIPDKARPYLTVLSGGKKDQE